MNKDEIIKQSKNVYKQWSKLWAKNATAHKDFPKKSFEDFRNSGIGRAALLVASGFSFEENLETIKKYAHNVDIICCDKTLGHLIDNGIYPKICITCDSNISYEKYLKPWEDKLSSIILFNNVCGNPEWSKAKWKSTYLYVNKDVMGYEKEFIELSGCKNIVTAGTNVSNMMVVLLYQADNEVKQNLFCYDKLILIGFDYSWKQDGKYYAFDESGGGKFNYMRHVYGLSLEGNLIYSSNNLSGSGSWLNLYVKAFKVPVVQCGKDSLYNFGRIGDLETNLKYRHRPSDRERVRHLLNKKLTIEQELKKMNNELVAINRDHWLAEMKTL